MLLLIVQACAFPALDRKDVFMKNLIKIVCRPINPFTAFLLGIIIGFMISPIKKGIYFGNRDITY
jgi:hypothetical protein